jgi:predicted transcriptional regulator YdeE
MKPERIDIAEDIVIVGIALATTPETAARDIPAFWQRFLSEDVASQLTRGADRSIYAVYCDYRTDYSGPYTLVLGGAVPSDTPIPTGMRRVRIVSGRYAAFPAKGEPSEVIWRTWAEINQRWPGRSERRYVSDFERYRPEAMSGGSLDAEILVGLR